MISTILSCLFGYLVVKGWQRREQIERLFKAWACRLQNHPPAMLEIESAELSDRLSVKCYGCGFESDGLSVPRRNA